VLLVRTRFQNGFLWDFIVYYKVVYLNESLLRNENIKQNDRMPFLPGLKLKNSFWSALFWKRLRKLVKMRCKTIARNKVLIHFSLLQVWKTQYSVTGTVQHNKNMTYQKKNHRTI
jgi:hypothetical protein